MSAPFNYFTTPIEKKEEGVFQPPYAVFIKEEWVNEREKEEDEDMRSTQSTQSSFAAYEARMRKDVDELIRESALLGYGISTTTTEGNITYPINSALAWGGQNWNTEQEIMPNPHTPPGPGVPSTSSEGMGEKNKFRPGMRPMKQYNQDSEQEDATYRCPNCSLCYTNPKYLAGHVRRGCRYRPSPIDNSYPCTLCGEAYNNWGDLYKHKRLKHIHSVQGTRAKATPGLKQKAKTQPSTVQRLNKLPDTTECANCSKPFTSRGNLLQHIRMHKAQKTRHVCDICREDFHQLSRLQMEEHFSESHPSSPIHRCDQCDRVYSYLPNLVTHLQTHIEFKCFICKQQLPSQELLFAHLRTHANDRIAAYKSRKPFECNICKKTYSYPGRFFEHRRRQHNIIEKFNMEAKDEITVNTQVNNNENYYGDEVQVVQEVSPESVIMIQEAGKDGETLKIELPFWGLSEKICRYSDL